MTCTTALVRSKIGVDILFDAVRYEKQMQNKQTAVQFLNDFLGCQIDDENLHQELKDGVLLCKLVNEISPGVVRHVGHKDLSFIKMDNITRFLQGARQLGLDNSQLFDASDLFEAKDMNAVIDTILIFRQMCLQSNILTQENETRECHEQCSDSLKQFDDEKSDKQSLSAMDTVCNTDPTQVNDILFSHAMEAITPFVRPPKSPLRYNPILHHQNHKNMRRRSEDVMRSRRKSIEGSPGASSCSSSHSRHYNRQTCQTNRNRKILKTINTAAQECRIQEKLLLKSKDGTVRANYLLGNCIGKGQFGSVYRALDLCSGGTVAVKRVQLEDADLDNDIMKEIHLLRTLSHTNVVQYIGFIRSENHVNIILEYAENGSLLSTLRAFGAFPEKLVALFCVKILNGLEYLHANEVVHCDLKAANILTTKTGDVKLSDFGVSLNMKMKGADPEKLSGTPNWMAPEVIQLEGTSPKSDIWSLGCTLIELVTGKPPYADFNAMSAMFHIVEDDFPPLPDGISSEMHSFLLACFQKDPDNRPVASKLKKHIWLQDHQEKLPMTEDRLSGYFRPPPLASQALTSSVDDLPQDQLDDGDRLKTDCPSLENNNSVAPCKSPNFQSYQEYATHRFIRIPFGKECKVCCDLITSEALSCEVCRLICHKDCKPYAFSCPPKIMDQQMLYDWVFLAKIYNHALHNRATRSPNRCQQPNNAHRKCSVVHDLDMEKQSTLDESKTPLTRPLASISPQCIYPGAVQKLVKKRKDCTGGQ